MSMMKYLLLPIAVVLLFGGCANKRGLSATYYNDCREYYDLQGYHHTQCDDNMVDYDELDGVFAEEPPVDPNRKVW